MSSNLGDLTGRTLGNCTLVRMLGQGGMGAVYLAQQTRPARNVAVKVLLPNLAMNSQVYQEFLTRFRREADVIARLEHINIMPIYEYGEQDGLAYLVMPHLTGGSLKDILVQRGSLSLADATSYISQAASALDYAHAQGVIHRDLKPANFLLHADGRLVLADFGIARIMEESTSTGHTLTSTGAILGTPEYMAPEMARGESVDYRADIYELGIVLYHMLSGRVPFSGGSAYAVVAKHIQQPIPLLHQSNPGIPPAVDAVIQKATAKQRENRYTTVKAMAQELADASSFSPITYNNNQFTQGNAPTVIAPQAQSLILPPPQYDMPATQLRDRTSITPLSASNSGAGIGGRGYTPAPPVYQTYPQQYQPTTIPPVPQRKHSPWGGIILALFALLIIAGSVFAGLAITQKNGLGGQPSLVPTTVVNNAAPTATTGTIPTAAPTAPSTQPSPTPPANTTNTTAPAVGTQIYAATGPGTGCDKNGGTWTTIRAKIRCLGGGRALITNTNAATAERMGGSLLTNLPNQDYPTNYVVEAQLQLLSRNPTNFGLYFYNQPGNLAANIYMLLIRPDGGWIVIAGGNGGTSTIIAQGQGAVNDVHAPVTLAVVANGQQLSFYANGTLLKQMNEQTYANGTAGIAVGQGGSVEASNFALYMPAQQ